MLSRTIESKACRHCGAEFRPWSSTQTVCGRVCAQRMVKAEKVAGKAAAKAERAADKVKREDQKPLRKLVAEAQAAFNPFIRERDKDLPCVSCGETNPPMTSGGQWDAGHYLTRGAHPELRFDEDNVHKQCKSCNGGSEKNGAKALTVSARFREELLRRIGPERLERLEGPHEVTKLDRDVLRQIKVVYRAKLRTLKKGNA
jgi:hypothetical protein